jgi:uncharacterized Zn-finger protein
MLNNYFIPDVTQWTDPQKLFNVEDRYSFEDRGKMPIVLQQVFACISNTSCSADLQSKIRVVGTEEHGSQQTDGGCSVTEGQNVFRCTQCRKVYMSKGNLTRHLKFECGKEPQFQCPHCPIRTKHKSSLLTHIYCKHGGT